MWASSVTSFVLRRDVDDTPVNAGVLMPLLLGGQSLFRCACASFRWEKWRGEIDEQREERKPPSQMYQRRADSNAEWRIPGDVRRRLDVANEWEKKYSPKKFNPETTAQTQNTRTREEYHEPSNHKLQ
jgi:hypothetical protein